MFQESLTLLFRVFLTEPHLGIKINPQHKKRLIGIAKAKNMQIYQMDMEKDRYGFKYKKIR